MEFSLPEDHLQPLLIASKSSNLKDALQILLETSSLDSGRANLALKGVLPSLLELSNSIPYPSGHVHLTLSLKLLRNLCAGDLTNQTLFISLNGPTVLSSVLRSVRFDSEPDCLIIRFGLQVLANVCLAGPDHQQAIWLCYFPNEFDLLAKIRSRSTCDPLCMIIYTCCDGNTNLFIELCGDRGLMIVAEIVRTVSLVGYVEDWFKLLLSRICLEEAYFYRLFSLVSCIGCPDNAEGGSIGEVFSTEQACLLSTVSAILNERLEDITVSVDFALHVFGIFKRSAAVIDSGMIRKSTLPTGCAAIDVLGYSLTILRDICAQRPKVGLDDNSEVIDTLLSCGLLELMFVVLRELEPPVIIKKAMKQNENQQDDSLRSYKPCLYKGFRRDICAVIGNCAFQRKDVQDEIRQKNMILVLLQQCVTDEDNPFLREWAIWCVRNLLEGNIENQKAVAELELQGTVEVPELSGLGLRVEVDPNTRRAKLVNVSSSHDNDGSLCS